MKTPMPSRRLAVVALAMKYAPFVALAVLLALVASWPAAVVFGFVVIYYRGRRLGFRRRETKAARTVAELLVAGLLGAVVGGLLFDGLGVIFGVAFGLTLRLAEIPISRAPSTS